MKIKNTIRCLYGRFLIIAGLTLITVGSAQASYQSTVQADNPIAYFALDTISAGGSGTATDLSGNGNNSPYINVYPIAGPTAYVPNAGLFDPTLGSTVNLPSAGILNNPGTITMEAWVQPANTTQSLGDIIAKGYDSTANIENVLRVNQNQFQGGAYTNGVSKMANGGVVTTNWAYVVTTFDGTNWNTYVNTILVAQTADTVGAVYSSDTWAIGNGTVDAAGTRNFNGNICEVALYTNALTPAQIINHYVVAELNTPAAGARPVIAVQPQTQASYVGGTVTLSVVAASATSTTNLWFKNGSPIGRTNSTLVLNNLALGDAGNYSVVVGNINGTTNSAVAVLTVTTPANLTWSGAGGATWDTGTTASWLNQSTSATTVFNFGDAVLFDDTPGVPTSITFSGLVTPSTMTVNSSVNNFSFSPYSPGNNTVTGPVKLIKKGTSTLTLGTAGQFGGPVDIEAGVVLAQGYSFQSVPSVTITNNSTLDLSGGNYVNLQQTMYISGTGVSGEAAIYNSTYNPSMAFNIALTGDATIGAHTGNAWSMSGGSISGPHVLTLDWSTVNDYAEWDGPINIGADVVGITITNGTLGLKYMTTACQNPNTVFTADTNTTFAWWNGTGGFDGSIHMLSNSIARLWSAGTVYSGTTITLDGPMDWSTWGDPGDITFDSAMVLNGIVHVIIGDHNTIYTNVISGPGGLFLDYWNHAMVLSAVNTYTGPTIINDGLQVNLTGNGSISQSSLIFFGGSDPTSTHLDATGRSNQTMTLASGQTLGGIGGVNGSLVVLSGAIISPAGTNTVATMDGPVTSANPVGTIAASSSVTLNGTTVIKLNGSGTNDLVQAGANITYGGTLNLVNISGSPLAVGNSFQVFSAAIYTGSFASITPPTPGAGLAWDTTQLSSGVIKVALAPAQPVIGSTKVSSGNLIFSGTGGTANGNYWVLTATNLTIPFGSWPTQATYTYDATGAFSVTNAISPGTPARFYRIKQ
jgi:autotransporter-associated beta strand protein